MAEGDFPKSNGDVLYASEVNFLSRNYALGIVPTISNWNTDPTNLSNATDGDPDTETTAGSLQDEITAIFQFDLGVNKVHNTIAAKFTFTSTADPDVNRFATLYVSEDDITYNEITDFNVFTPDETIDKGIILPPSLSKFRYIQISCTDDNSGTPLTLKIAELRLG